MLKPVLRITLVVLSLALCVLACNIPLVGDFLATPTATITPTTTPTSSPTPTLTPTPSPTPLPLSRIQSGDQARWYGDWDTAFVEYQLAYEMAQDPEQRAAAELGMALTHLQARQYYEALQSLTGHLEKYPNDPSQADVFFLRALASKALGEDQQVIDDFDQYLALRPGPLDSYVHEEVGDALRRTGRSIEAISRYQAAIDAPRTGGTLILQIKTSYAYFEAGQFLEAYEQFNQAYHASSDSNTKAALNLMAGRSLEALGDYEAAYERYLDALYAFPQANETYLGLITLVDAGVIVDDFQRGLVDYFAEAYEPGLAAFNRYVATTPTGTAYYYRGLTKREMGDAFGGLLDFQIVLDSFPEDAYWTATWFDKAYTEWIYLSDPESAVQTLLSFVDIDPGNSSAAEALYEAGRISDRMGALKEAALIWLRIPQEYPHSAEAFVGAYKSGISSFRLGNYREARDAFLLADAIAIQPGDKAAARLWVGKTHSAEGDPIKAEEAWVRAAVVDPTGYYSERAADLVAGREPFESRGEFSFPSDLSDEKVEAENWLRTTFAIQSSEPLSELGTVLSSDQRVLRGDEFWRLGLYEEARAEFESMRAAYSGDAEATYRLMQKYLDIGLYRSAIFAARNILNLAGMDDAGTMDAPIYFNYIRFGNYFGELILPEAEKLGLNGLFTLSLVRQESLFEGFITSYADARGLMQVIPTTGQDIANKLGWPPGYSSFDLYRPIVSVRFGTSYLADQRDFFDGDLYGALSAYNAGPGNTLVWKEIVPDDPDLFLEIIRLEQPQRYIRTIFEVYDIYYNLYIVP